MKMLLVTVLILAGCASQQTVATSAAPVRRMVQMSSAQGVVAPPPTLRNVNLEWNPSAGAASYNVYYGTRSRGYTAEIPTTKTFLTVPDLTVGSEYFFAVTAADEFGDESDFSDELAHRVPPPSGWIVLRLCFRVPVGSLTNIYTQVASDPLGTWAACDQCFPLSTNAANNEVDWLAPDDPGQAQQFFRAAAQEVNP